MIPKVFSAKFNWNDSAMRNGIGLTEMIDYNVKLNKFYFKDKNRFTPIGWVCIYFSLMIEIIWKNNISGDNQ